VEQAEEKILLETFESIPRSFDIANVFSKDDIAPIFEVILPMTTGHVPIDNIYQYYSDFVVGKRYKRLGGHDTTIAEWIGTFPPKRINVIPLFEDKDSMLNAHTSIHRYLLEKELPYQRVFLARSDPAMNYGLVSAVLLIKIALRRLALLQERITTPLFPIIGVGSAPFRGNLRPDTVDRVTAEYPSIHTFTIQSAFKYDYPLEDRTASPPPAFDEKQSQDIIAKYTESYIRELAPLSEIINRISAYVPSRRKRKLHTGLFGYSRNTGGIKLPRAITFTAALYSLGLPPEFLGLSALDPKDLAFVRDVYVNFDQDLADAVRYLNPDSPYISPSMASAVERISGCAPDDEHKEITDCILKTIREGRDKDLPENILRAAQVRRFLG
jgi:phosphoenolpyruvate carboxylase